jgi:excisionase family DNA binding protein
MERKILTLITREQAAEYLGVTKQYLDLLASKKKGPPFFKLARRAVRYDLTDLHVWVRERRVSADALA